MRAVVLPCSPGSRAARRPAFGCQLFGHDQVDGHDDLIVEAGPSEPRLPDARLIGEDESGGSHRVAERRDRTEQRRVEHDVCVGRERLVAGDAACGAEIHGLRADEDDRIEV